MSVLSRFYSRAARPWRRRFKKQVLILLYHRVADLASDPWALCVTPQHFAEHLDVLVKQTFPMALENFLACVETRRFPARSVVVTFDDGYADNLSSAKPLLERFEVPAVFFITTSSIGDQGEFWWDRLERILFEPAVLPDELALNVSGEALQWSTEMDSGGLWGCGSPNWKAWEKPPGERHRLYQILWRWLQPLRMEEREDAFRQLFRWAGLEPTVRSTHRAMKAEELQALADGRLIEVGAHTRTHARLSSLPLSMQRDEIAGSKHDLERTLHRPVRAFSYPYGGSTDYTESTAAIVKEAGFCCACSNIPGRVVGNTDPFALPRVQIPDCDGETFSRHLSTWFGN